MTCGVRAKVPGRHRCVVCLDRTLPIGDRVANSRRRLAMVPEELRVARVSKKDWPAGQRWCASCQSFVDLEDTSGSRCKPCASAATHAARIEKTYGLTAAGYDELLALQGGRCAICHQRPGKKKRFAVDHDHQSGAVRGLLCGRCNHDLLGAGFDSKIKMWAAYVYLDTPPATGSWTPIPKQTLPDRTPPAERVEFGRPGGKPRKPDTPAPAPAAFAPAMRPPVWSRHMSAEDSAHYWAIMREAYELGPAAPF